LSGYPGVRQLRGDDTRIGVRLRRTSSPTFRGPSRDRRRSDERPNSANIWGPNAFPLHMNPGVWYSRWAGVLPLDQAAGKLRRRPASNRRRKPQALEVTAPPETDTQRPPGPRIWQGLFKSECGPDRYRGDNFFKTWAAVSLQAIQLIARNPGTAFRRHALDPRQLFTPTPRLEQLRPTDRPASGSRSPNEGSTTEIVTGATRRPGCPCLVPAGGPVASCNQLDPNLVGLPPAVRDADQRRAPTSTRLRRALAALVTRTRESCAPGFADVNGAGRFQVIGPGAVAVWAATEFGWRWADEAGAVAGWTQTEAQPAVSTCATVTGVPGRRWPRNRPDRARVVVGVASPSSPMAGVGGRADGPSCRCCMTRRKSGTRGGAGRSWPYRPADHAHVAAAADRSERRSGPTGGVLARDP